MKPSKQAFFNRYRENTIIEVVQALAKSSAGSQIAFKGGTALKLFYDLPRFSEDIDYDSFSVVSPPALMDIIERVFLKKKWEITDRAIKYHTLLLELRFAGPDRNFRLKVEISTRDKEIETTVLTLRGVPVLTLNPSYMMTEKLFAFVERQAGRDLFDAWFILKNGYPLDEPMIKRAYGDRANLYKTMLNVIEKADAKKIHHDTGKLLEKDYRNWISTSFLSDFKRLIGILSQEKCT